jgi:hypothetical protein
MNQSKEYTVLDTDYLMGSWEIWENAKSYNGVPFETVFIFCFLKRRDRFIVHLIAPHGDLTTCHSFERVFTDVRLPHEEVIVE